MLRAIPAIPANRFIPASAGNRSRRCPNRPEGAVHPRERGEQVYNVEVRNVYCGSSPRARGTGRPCHRERPGRRFIPASAGNSFPDHRPGHRRTVHPRERGEQVLNPVGSVVGVGSSPRARGTAIGPGQAPPSERFIPASAGNSHLGRQRLRPTTVHPRERGEQSLMLSGVPYPCGSSPRARGTGKQFARFLLQGRFIPASAGNSVITPAMGQPLTVHPRERGEQDYLIGALG